MSASRVPGCSASSATSASRASPRPSGVASTRSSASGMPILAPRSPSRWSRTTSSTSPWPSWRRCPSSSARRWCCASGSACRRSRPPTSSTSRRRASTRSSTAPVSPSLASPRWRRRAPAPTCGRAWLTPRSTVVCVPTSSRAARVVPLRGASMRRRRWRWRTACCRSMRSPRASGSRFRASQSPVVCSSLPVVAPLRSASPARSPPGQRPRSLLAWQSAPSSPRVSPARRRPFATPSHQPAMCRRCSRHPRPSRPRRPTAPSASPTGSRRSERVAPALPPRPQLPWVRRLSRSSPHRRWKTPRRRSSPCRRRKTPVA